MNELKQLIEQYERENLGEFAKHEYLDCEGEIERKWGNDFVLWLASRPTCGVEQRKFLDEVEKRTWITTHAEYTIAMANGTPGYSLYQQDFVADLDKVIKGE